MTSILGGIAEALKQKKNSSATKSTYQKKTKLPTEYKTKRHRCSLCKELSIKTLKISDKDFRRLCHKHYEEWVNQDGKYKVNFQRANGNKL